MGILEYLLGSKDSDADDVQAAPSSAGAGPDVDQGRIKTKTDGRLPKLSAEAALLPEGVAPR